MAKKAVALALSIIAIVFCISNVDRRVSAEYDAEVVDEETANVQLEIPTEQDEDQSEELEIVKSSEAAPTTAPQPTTAEKTYGMDFSLKRLIVQTDDENILKKYSTKITALIKGFYFIDFDSEEATRNAYLELSDLDSIKAVSVDVKVKLSAVLPEQYAWGVENIGADHYTDWLKINENNNIVKIGVIDSGINKDHLAFKNASGINDRIVITSNTKDYVNGDTDPDDENGHGTAVAGVIAESTPSNIKIYPSKVFGASGKTDGGGLANIFLAMDNAVNYDKVDIINLSLGLDTESDEEAFKCTDPTNELVSNYFNEIRNEYGVLVIAAAGNSANSVSFPANCPDVVAVSSIKSDRSFSSSFSNYGPEIDFAMPGEDLLLPTIIKSTDVVPDQSFTNDNALRTISGTSLSSPFLAAAASLIKAENPNYTPAQIIAALKTYAVSLGDSNLFGNGVVDFGAKKFNIPHVYAKADSSAAWAKSSTIKVGAVSSFPINGVAYKLNSATPTSADWITEGISANLYTVPVSNATVADNGTYTVWFRNTAGNSGKATATITNIDKLGPNFASNPNANAADINNTSVAITILDSQSGLKNATLYYRKKGSTGSYQQKSISYNNVNTQTTASFTLSGLDYETTYEFYITATDALGNSSTSEVSLFMTPMTDPIVNEPTNPTDTPLPDAGETTINNTPETVKTSMKNNTNNPVTLDPVVIYFSGFIGSCALGFAIYRTIGGRR